MQQHAMPNCMERLQHAKTLGFTPQTIFDGGAFKGTWTLEVATLFPGAQIVAVEPNPFLQSTLRENLSRVQPEPIVIEAALGATAGTTSFNIWGTPDDDMSASLLGHVQGRAKTTVSVTVETVDGIAERIRRTPDLLKLDLQGAEILALKGAAQTLRDAKMVVVEFGCLAAYEQRATPRQLLDLLYDSGFVLYDIVDCIYRPYDGALSGGDFFFIHDSSPLRAHSDWK
jgi:FkbM family methyltransferase